MHSSLPQTNLFTFFDDRHIASWRFPRQYQVTRFRNGSLCPNPVGFFRNAIHTIEQKSAFANIRSPN